MSGGGLRSWLELARISNLPTCASNVLVGAALGWSAAGPADGTWWRVAVVIGAIALLYVAGMFLNDAFDAAVDRRALSRSRRLFGESARRRGGARRAALLDHQLLELGLLDQR